METKEQITVTGQSGSPGGGPYAVLTFTVKEGKVLEGTFDTNGCPAAHTACCGVIAFMKNRPIEQGLRMDGSDLLVLIGGLPEGKGHYANIAVDAMKDALSKCHLPMMSVPHTSTEEGTHP